MKTIKQQKGTVARKPARIKQEFRRENQPFILNHIFKKKASADDLLPESKVGTPVVNHTTAAQIYQNILKYYFVIYKNNSDKKQGEEGFRYSEILQWLIKEKKEMMNNPIWRKYDGSHISISSIKAHLRETVEDGYLKDFTNSTLLLAEEAPGQKNEKEMTKVYHFTPQGRVLAHLLQYAFPDPEIPVTKEECVNVILKEYIAFLKMIGSYGADWLAEFFGAALEMGQGENVVYNLWKLLESDIQVTDVVEMFRKTQMALIHDAKTKGKFAKIWVTAIRRLPENARPMIMMHDKYVTESNILLKLPPREYYEVCFRHMADYEKLTICAFCPECKIWHPATVDYFKYRSLVPLGAKGTCARCKKEIMNVTDNVDFIGTNAMPKGGGREEIRYRLAVFGPQPPADKR